MATTIKLKNGSGVPTAGQLVQGEPALDLVNKRLYTENSGGTVIEVGTNPTGLTVGTGRLSLEGVEAGANWVYLGNETSTHTGALRLQAGGGSAGFGGGLALYGHAHATNAGDVAVGISSGSNGSFRVNTHGIDTGANVLSVDANGDVSFYNDAGTSTVKMFWDASAESLGIGTTTPNDGLDIKVAGTAYGSGYVVSRHMDAAGTKGIFLGYDADEQGGTIGGANLITFQTYNVSSWGERMRIDSSGNLLVGKTSTNTIGTVGHDIAAAGYVMHTRDSSNILYLNRKTTDGSIAEFYKDGAQVGILGSYSGGNFYIEHGSNTGVVFSTNEIVPSQSAGGANDGNLSLGNSSRRFKDLYLSGGVYLGGTGAANHLDDYEEGTWTPTLPNGGTLTVDAATYTKVGRQVHLQCYVSAISPTANSTQFRIGGFPFTTLSGAGNYSVGSIGYTGDSNLADWMFIGQLNTTYGYFHVPASIVSRTNNDYIAAASGSTDQLILSITYFTA